MHPKSCSRLPSWEGAPPLPLFWSMTLSSHQFWASFSQHAKEEPCLSTRLLTLSRFYVISGFNNRNHFCKNHWPGKRLWGSWLLTTTGYDSTGLVLRCNPEPTPEKILQTGQQAQTTSPSQKRKVQLEDTIWDVPGEVPEWRASHRTIHTKRSRKAASHSQKKSIRGSRILRIPKRNRNQPGWMTAK